MNVYQKQTSHRDRLQENALEDMESLIQKMQSCEISNPKLELLITELTERLQNYSGKKVYGYLPPATKRIVDAIVDELASDKRVAEAYSLWQDMRDEVFSFYSKSTPERVPLSQQKEFKPVRNMVIREVVQMMEQQATLESAPPTPERRSLPPESVSACMIRMLHHMGNIFRDIVPCLGDIKLNKLTGRQIQKMYNDLLDHGRERVSQKEKNPGLSGTYVHGVHVMLHNCLNRAVKERLIVRNPADDVIVPKIDKKEMKILPPEQVKAYLKAASARGILPLFYLELTSGLRKGEIAALLWSDLDVENCTLSVTKLLVSSRDGELKITQPKTATSVRLISLPQETVELLKEEHAKHPLNIYMFPSPRTGGMYHPDSIVKLHEKILNDAGIEHLRFHDLRHPYVKHTTKKI